MEEDTYVVPSADSLFDRIARTEWGYKPKRLVVNSAGWAESMRSKARLSYYRLRERPYLVLAGIIFFVLFLALGWALQFSTLFSIIWAGVLFLVSVVTGLVGHVSKMISHVYSYCTSTAGNRPTESMIK